MDNIYYFKVISKIGGIETFFYELAKKYKDYDLVFYCDEIDGDQLERLNKFVDVRIRKYGEKVKCKRAFFNFNTDMIDDIEADEYILVIHGNYEAQGIKYPDHPKITRYVAVSKDSAQAYTKLSGHPCEVCYNPLEILEEEKPLVFISATRLSKEKGGNRMLRLMNAFDKYALYHNRKYLWLIFTDSDFKPSSRNVVLIKPHLDIRAYYKLADYVIQLSDLCEGYNYTVNESLSLGMPCVITPSKVYEELGITNDMAIRLEADLSNIDEVVEKVFNNKMKFSYHPPTDEWDKLLIKGKKKEYTKMKIFLCKATDECINYQRNGIALSEAGGVPKKDEIFKVSEDRIEKINKAFEFPLIEVIEEFTGEIKKENKPTLVDKKPVKKAEIRGGK